MSRTKAQRVAAKKLLRLPPGKFEPVDLDNRQHPGWMTRAYKNNRYVVMIEDNAKYKGIPTIKAMVQRHDDKPIPGHWRQLQNIKNELFGSESTAIEFYPPETELEDYANIYWLWVIPPRYKINLFERPSVDKSKLLMAEVAELREALARCRHQASYTIGGADALSGQLRKIREIANEALTTKPCS